MIGHAIAGRPGFPFHNQDKMKTNAIRAGCPSRLCDVVGASRKRFISSVTPSPPDRRLGGSLAAHLTAVQNGARIIRAHDVYETVQALRVRAAIEEKR